MWNLPEDHPVMSQKMLPIYCGDTSFVFEFITTKDPVYTPFASANSDDDPSILMNIFVNLKDNSVIVTETNPKTHTTCLVYDGGNFRPSGAKPEVEGIDN